MEKISNCFICDNTLFVDFKKVKDHFLTKEDFIIQECKKCGFRFVNPRPYESNLQNYYKSDEYISHSDTKKGFISKLYHFFRKINLSKKFKIVSNKISEGKLLDIGCATAAFLNYTKNKNWEVFGIEPNEVARKLAKQLYNIDVKSEKEIVQLPDNYFDVITMWHVLEHVADLNFYLKEIKRVLKNNGKAYIALPNHLSYDAVKYDNYWAAWDVPRHLYHFCKNSFINLAQKHDFIVSKIIPMKFDAYYVSLLSEKYKTGSSNYFSAFLNGVKSNYKARRNMNNYSSLIYVIENNTI